MARGLLRGSSAMLRVGTDLVSVGNVAESLSVFGNRFLERVFAPGEVEHCRSAPALAAERLATRFAAKEAMIKVLRPGAVGLDWRSIEVVADPADCVPRLVLHGAAAQLARARRIKSVALSLSHETGYATATVVALVSPRARRVTLGRRPRRTRDGVARPTTSNLSGGRRR